MQYVGLHTQQARNNFKSGLLLCLFPCLVVLLIFLFSVLLVLFTENPDAEESTPLVDRALVLVRHLAPYLLGGVALWFLIAYFANTAIIRSATGARSLERKDNKRVYNLVENLCMSQGMPMPKIDVIEDDSLNAYAGGINKKTYTVTLSRGIINKLNDEELEAVIAHELSHIRNRDVRLLIVSIVFVGIFAMLTEIAVRSLRFTAVGRKSKDNKGAIIVVLVALVVAVVGYFFATLMRFAISRSREYMADAGAAAMTRRPQALASALRKISQDPAIEAVTRDDVAQLFIEHPRHRKTDKQLFSGLSGLFATHPPIKKRIAILEQF